MQQETTRRSNLERTRATRARLLAAARALFVAKGYAETGTPEIVATAEVTRGALYHHFADKQALFRAVVEQEMAAVAGEIEKATPTSMPPLEALIAGGTAFMRAMRTEGRTRLLLLDGPAVLGRAELDRIDLEKGGLGSLRTGLAAALQAGVLPGLPLDALTALLAAAFDRAALAVDAGAQEADYETAIAAIIDGLAAARPDRG